MTTYSVAEVARIVSRAISSALPEEIWIQGEIRDLSRAASGHVYFSLVDSNPEQEPAALLPVALFASDKVAVNRILQRSGALRMTDGVEVRIRGQISHYAARGTVQLRMTWIDTEYTLGRLAAERERLVRSLEQQGLLEKNRALPLPLVPLRVGLVTSRGSAAEADFNDELRRSGYAWEVELIDARVQGAEAVPEIVSALNLLGRLGVDVIALVRGGGAQTDLAVFDDEAVAVAIANLPVPVLTGIGHEIDVSVADLVARSFKTPTACGAALVGRVGAFLDRLDAAANRIDRATGHRLRASRHELDAFASRISRSTKAAASRSRIRLEWIEGSTHRAGRELVRRHTDHVASIAGRTVRGAGVHVEGAGGVVDRAAAAVATSTGRAIADAIGFLDDLEHRVDLSDPRRLLARGWSITRVDGGDLVTDPDHVEPGVHLRTTVAGGEVVSVVAEEASDG